MIDYNLFLIIISVLIYLFLVLFGIVKISNSAKSIYNILIAKIEGLIKKNQQFEKIISSIRKKVIPFISVNMMKLIGILTTSGGYLAQFDYLLEHKTFNNIAEPVNLTSLTLRKIYNGTPSLWIIYGTITVVAFYFILTIF